MNEEEFKKHLDEQSFNKYISESMLKVNFLKQVLSSPEMLEYKRKSKLKDIQDDYFLSLIIALPQLAIFLDDEISETLERLSIGKHISCWLCDYRQLKKLIDEVNAVGNIYITPYHAIILIQQYLYSVLIDLILRDFKLITRNIKGQNTDYNYFVDEMNKYNRRVKRYIKNGVEPPIETAWHKNLHLLVSKWSELSSYYSTTSRKANNSEFEKVLSGKSHIIILGKIFRPPVTETLQTQGIMDYYYNFHPLFRYLLPTKVYSENDVLRDKGFFDTNRNPKQVFYSIFIKRYLRL